MTLYDTVDARNLPVDDLDVVVPRAAGLDVHKMRIIAAVRLFEAGVGLARAAVQEFSSLPDGLRAMTGWLRAHGVTAAAMEGTGIYWQAPFEALEDAGIRPRIVPCPARQADPRHRCQRQPVAGPHLSVRPRRVELRPSRRFRRLRELTRYRRKLAAERSRNRNRVHKTLDRDGLCIGGILTDIFGVNRRRILDGLATGLAHRGILDGLTHHAATKLEPLARALPAELDPVTLVLLQMRMAAADRADAAPAALDKRIRAELADYQRPLRLLQTIPGIDFGSACTIPAEIGPDPGAEPRRLGPASRPATTPAPASGVPAGRARAIRRCGRPSPNAPTAPCAPKAPSSTATTGPTRTASVTSGRSSPPPTSCCG